MIPLGKVAYATLNVFDFQIGGEVLGTVGGHRACSARSPWHQSIRAVLTRQQRLLGGDLHDDESRQVLGVLGVERPSGAKQVPQRV